MGPILFVQNDFEKSNILEKNIFNESIISGKMICIQENHFSGIKALFIKRKIQKLFHRIFDSWILNSTNLSRELERAKNSGKPYKVVFFLNTTFAIIKYPYFALKRLKQKYGVRFVLYYIDSISRPLCNYANYLADKGLFDVIYSFDKEDCVQKGYKYWSTPYSRQYVDENADQDVDLYFCGIDTDRVNILKEINRVEDMTIEMDIISKEVAHNCPSTERIRYHSLEDILPYPVVISNVIRSKCILELVRPGQSGLTLRPYEAVVYNKKLLTNNREILSFPYYSEDKMQLFSSTEKIDWEWIKNDSEVEYNYDGRFSSDLLMEEIEKELRIVNK